MFNKVIGKLKYQLLENFPLIKAHLEVENFYRPLILKQSEGIRRYDLINAAIESRQYKTYLEIGVNDPKNCFEKIKIDQKFSVDPGIEYSANPVDYPFTSDTFFEKLINGELKEAPRKFDLIFLDGLHRAEQLSKDIDHALVCLNPGGMIFLHDCLPPHEFFARESPAWTYQTGGPWNGTSWKAFAKYLSHGEFDAFIADTDWGVAVIDSLRPSKRTNLDFRNPFFEFDVYTKQIEKFKIKLSPGDALTRIRNLDLLISAEKDKAGQKSPL